MKERGDSVSDFGGGLLTPEKSGNDRSDGSALFAGLRGGPSTAVPERSERSERSFPALSGQRMICLRRGPSSGRFSKRTAMPVAWRLATMRRSALAAAFGLFGHSRALRVASLTRASRSASNSFAVPVQPFSPCSPTSAWIWGAMGDASSARLWPAAMFVR